MPSIVSRSGAVPTRKRRAHGKSRGGCGNCKLRRVKCDETRPRCKRCLAYRVSCNYDGAKTSLDPSAQGSFQVDLTPSEEVANVNLPPIKTPFSMNRTTASMIDASLHARSLTSGTDAIAGDSPIIHNVSFWTFTESDLEVMKRFQERTVLTIGNSQTSPAYRDCIGHLAFSHPFLMHMLLGLTLMHDAYLSTPHSPQAASSYQHASLQHWNTATRLFNNILSRPLPPSYRDAVWATGALLGATVFAYVESPNSEESWPLRPSDPTDLAWLKLSDGKKALWKIANPTRPDSMFRTLAKDLNHLQLPAWATEPDFAAIPESWKRAFYITPRSTVNNNVYYFPIIILSRLHGLTPNYHNILDFLYFMAYMPSKFKRLLETKDPRALLLLLWWYRKLEHGEHWWIKRRAKIEGDAIEIWLEKWYGGETGVSLMYDILEQTSEVDEPQVLPSEVEPVDEGNGCPVQ